MGEKGSFPCGWIALRDQALDAFKEHIPSEPSGQPRRRRIYKRRRVYVTTYHNAQPHSERNNSWKLDFLFFWRYYRDESHRSIYNTYLQVLEYFNVVKIGFDGHAQGSYRSDTFSFSIAFHNPTFAYTLKKQSTMHLLIWIILKYWMCARISTWGIRGGELPPEIKKKLTVEGIDIEDIDFEALNWKESHECRDNALDCSGIYGRVHQDPSGTCR